MIELQPVTFREACLFIEKHHSHHLPPQGHKFSIAVNNGEEIVGVITVGRPIARYFDNGWTAEVTRCCTDRTKNASSMLYAAAWRASRAMGYRRLITYTLKEEQGTSILAAGWKLIGETGNHKKGWDCPSRPRIVKNPIGQKLLWEVK